MTRIKPFRAIVYNQEKIKDLTRVVCPPYDIISPLSQQYYHNLNPYNFIHILLGKDITGENKYRRAANYFKDCLKNRILIHDEKPAVYFYSHQYNLRGEKRIRLGFIGLLYLDSDIFGHERTRLEPKEDRLKLLKNVKANLSPIFVLFPDSKRIIQRLYQQDIEHRKPFIDIIDNENAVHKLWRLDSPDTLNRIQAGMQKENIFIADGHHRYEVACAYRNQIKRKSGAIKGDGDFNYIMAYFTNVASRGLTVLPIHRLAKLDSKLDMEDFKVVLSEYFDVREVKDKTQFFFLMEKGGQTEHVLGMYKNKRYWLLRLKNIKILDKMISDRPPEYKSLDISILNYIVLKKILGINLEDKERLVFSPNPDELIESVDNNQLYIALFLNPAKIQQITSLALNNEKMPAKTTYFYPKVLSGLVINKFE
ncbi:MAG: DUF1015 domain-containing protein [Candidatus Omnitrophica bacterium]|nr:DUF1015 domain-containing protein [Candidatus Omnitrophota bacterium]MCG2707001.1 DUF1015 domain-containing protein [Candidatus Omnitrophota bacterium]